MSYDVFICHASEDKKDFVEPLARVLQQRGLSVWYDDFVLKIGDSLSESIDRGLADSLYGVVVISPNFKKKKWTRRELGAFLAREGVGDKVILPVWHNITAEEIKEYSPLLADIVAVSSSAGMDAVIRKILEVVTPDLVRQKAGAIGRLADLSALIRDYLAANLDEAKRFGFDVKGAVGQAQEALAILADALDKVARASDPNDVLLNLEKAKRMVRGVLAYCPKCKSRETMVDTRVIQMKSGKSVRSARKGRCPNCGTTMFTIL